MKRLLIGALIAAATLTTASVASARDYGYGYYDRHYDGGSRYRDRDRDGVPDRWDRRDNRRDYRRHRHHHHHGYYRHYDGPRYGYYDRPYRYEYRRDYYRW